MWNWHHLMGSKLWKISHKLLWNKRMKFCLLVVRLLLAFFNGLVIQKSATKTATSIKSAGDWNGLLEHNIIDHDILKLIKHLHCLNQFKSEPFHHQQWVGINFDLGINLHVPHHLFLVCPVAIPEIFVQTQLSDYWQLFRWPPQNISGTKSKHI